MYSSPSKDATKPLTLNKTVFLGSAIISILLIIWTIAFPDYSEALLSSSMAWVSESFGWYYMLVVAAYSIFANSLGREVVRSEIDDILQRLGFGVEHPSADEFSVTIPTYRHTKDINWSADLVEEVGRITGYNNIPPQAPLRQVPVRRRSRKAVRCATPRPQ